MSAYECISAHEERGCPAEADWGGDEVLLVLYLLSLAHHFATVHAGSMSKVEPPQAQVWPNKVSSER